MIIQARIFKYQRKAPDSPGWFSPVRFNDLQNGRMILPPQYMNMPIVNQYQASWESYTGIVNAHMNLVQDFFTLEDDDSYYTVLAFASLENFNAMMAQVDGTAEQTAMNTAREVMAHLLNVSITVFQPVEIDLSAYPTFTGKTLTQITSALTGAVLVA